MTQFDGHAAKRQRTDNEGGRDFGNTAGGGGAFYNNNFRPKGERFEEKPNHILLITVMNPAYPITTDVIHTICSPSGKVQRIVIFKKNGVQAMVEFDSLEAAERAKQSLNGCDIYSGCCTLKIEFAKPTRLNVYKNDNESWDYTNNNLGKTPGPGGDRPVLLQEPPRGYGPQGTAPPYDARGSGYDETGYNEGYMGPPRGPRQDPYGGPPGRDPYGGPQPDRFGRDPYRGDGGPPGGARGPSFGPGGPHQGAGGPQSGAVMMAYGLNHEKMNCDKLFNILCLYGNVARVKYLKSKEGCAMIQMADYVAVERAVNNLNGAVFFESKLQLGFSKQPYLNEVQQPFDLPDGTYSFKDYLKNRNNRFSTPEAAGKNRILPPAQTLHFFNAPFGITEEEIKKIFEDNLATPPSSVKLFESKNNSERSSSGLLEFEESSEALEALALCNHHAIPNPNGKFPYILKLCFSSTRNGPRGGGPRGPGGPPPQEGAF